MVKPLAFKGDKKAPKKRKRTTTEEDDEPTSKQLTTTNTTTPADHEENDDENQWVSADLFSDISGPIMLVLPSTPPTSLSVDQLGAVFPQKIENMVEGLPDSAEPHDIRQVWVATCVVGSESDFTFKSHHGRYLGCDKYGICSAQREAISPEETFKLLPVEGASGVFDVQTSRKTHLAVNSEKEPPELRGDAEEAGESTRVRIRMQARFKPKHKAEKVEKVRAKISRKELEEEVGRRLEDHEVKKLKRARREGNYHEAMLDVKVKGKHDKFA